MAEITEKTNRVIRYEHESLQQQYTKYAVKNGDPIDEQHLNQRTDAIKREVCDLYNQLQMSRGDNAIAYDPDQIYKPGEIVYFEDTPDRMNRRNIVYETNKTKTNTEIDNNNKEIKKLETELSKLNPGDTVGINRTKKKIEYLKNHNENLKVYLEELEKFNRTGFDITDHYVCVGESLGIEPFDPEYPSWNQHWRVVEMSQITDLRKDNILLKDGNEPYEPKNDYNPATKKYVDDLKKSIIADPANPKNPNKIQVHNSFFLGGIPHNEYILKSTFDSLSEEALKKSSLVNNLNQYSYPLDSKDKTNLQNKPLSGFVGKEIDERLKTAERFIDLKGDNKTNFKSLDSILNSQLDIKARLDNLNVANVVGLGTTIEKLEQNINNIDKKTTYVEKINLKDTSTGTAEIEKSRAMSAQWGRDVITRVIRLENLTKSTDLGITDLQSIAKFIRDNKKEIDTLYNTGITLKGKMETLDSNLTKSLNEESSKRSELDRKVIQINNTLNEIKIKTQPTPGSNLSTWGAIEEKFKSVDANIQNNNNNLTAKINTKANNTDLNNLRTKLIGEYYTKSNVYNKNETYDIITLDKKFNTKIDAAAANNKFLSKVSDTAPDKDNTYSLGNGTHKFREVHATDFIGTALKAKFADLAEKYPVEGNFKAGDVLGLQNGKGVLFQPGMKLLGVVADKPALRLNENAEGVFVTLKGLTPVKISGEFKLDQYVIADKQGKAITVDDYNFKQSKLLIGVVMEIIDKNTAMVKI